MINKSSTRKTRNFTRKFKPYGRKMMPFYYHPWQNHRPDNESNGRITFRRYLLTETVNTYIRTALSNAPSTQDA
ncbi:hypothetical protein N7467_006583 [Penicillium canescens]|nr:hypothetical protein N7467_006583 [Penicillium canescens]